MSAAASSGRLAGLSVPPICNGRRPAADALPPAPPHATQAATDAAVDAWEAQLQAQGLAVYEEGAVPLSHAATAAAATDCRRCLSRLQALPSEVSDHIATLLGTAAKQLRLASRAGRAWADAGATSACLGRSTARALFAGAPTRRLPPLAALTLCGAFCDQDDDGISCDGDVWGLLHEVADQLTRLTLSGTDLCWALAPLCAQRPAALCRLQHCELQLDRQAAAGPDFSATLASLAAHAPGLRSLRIGRCRGSAHGGGGGGGSGDELVGNQPCLCPTEAAALAAALHRGAWPQLQVRSVAPRPACTAACGAVTHTGSPQLRGGCHLRPPP